MLPLIILFAFAAGSDVPPNRVLHLAAIQEGFDGLISFNWSPDHSGPHSEFFTVDVMYANNTSVNFTGRAYIHFTRMPKIGNIVTAITITRPIVGESYKLTVTAARLSSDNEPVPGPPATSVIVFQGPDDALVPVPTNFRHRENSIDIRLNWEWKGNLSDSVWFFVECCLRANRTNCKRETTPNTALSMSLISRSIYDVKVVAHIKGSRDTDPVRTSAALLATLETRPEDPPKGVKNLKVIQQGFNGVMSLTWDSKGGYIHSTNIRVVDANNTPVKFSRRWRLIQLEKPIPGMKYKVWVTPVLRDVHGVDILGPSAVTSIVFQGRDNSISTPLGFRYAQLTPYGNFIQWDWQNADRDVRAIDMISYFIEYCKQNTTDCQTETTQTTSTEIRALSSGSKYDVRIVAHFQRGKSWKSVKTSEALAASMETLDQGRPAPRILRVVPACESPTLDRVPYLVSWSIPNNDRLIEVTFKIQSLEEPFESFEVVADGSAKNISVSLNYYTPYSFYPYATYDAGLNKTGASIGEFFDIERTIMGPSNPARHLRVNQDHFSNLVKLKWDRPWTTNGPLDLYRILVTDENDTVVLAREEVMGNQTSVSVRMANATFGLRYEIAINAIHVRDGSDDIVGQTATISVILVRFPWEVTACSIVLLVLAVIGLAIFVRVKLRRRLANEKAGVARPT